MRDIAAKANNVGDALPATDFNANLRSELQNIPVSAGFALDAEGGPDVDLNMLGKSIAMYGSGGGDFYADSGAANAYVLARSGLFKPVRAYFDGMVAVFIAGNTNTGASTVNVSTLGSKSITLEDGTALIGGEIIDYVVIRYSLGNDRFELLSGKSSIALPPNHINGLLVSNNSGAPTTDIDISTGKARNSTDVYNLLLSLGLIKQIDASWVVGTNQGGMFLGSVAADTTYHIPGIRKDSDASIDAGFDTSLSVANIPGGYTAFRRILSLKTDGSANIIPFNPTELSGGAIRIDYDTMINNESTSTPGTSRVTPVLTVPIDIPVIAHIIAVVSTATPTHGWFGPTSATDTTPSGSFFTHQTTGTGSRSILKMDIVTDISGQIAYRVDNGTATVEIFILGYTDLR